MIGLRYFVVVLCCLFSTSGFAASKFPLTAEAYQGSEAILVPAGNFNSEQRSYDSSKYSAAVKIVSKAENICNIKVAAEIYKLDPVSIMGAIIGEHTFNVNIWDQGQEAYIYMRRMWTVRFSENGLDLADVIKEPRYRQCESTTDNNYDLWECYEDVWKSDRRNGRRGSERSSIKWTFFNPMGAGYTYGLGQMGPERALRVTDLVNKVSHIPMVSVDDPDKLYDAILNPKTTIHYIAASNRIAIDTYRKIANFDISQNVGIIATLYNLGKEQDKATELRQKNLKSSVSGVGYYPEVNYYGWFVNSKEDELRAIYLNAIKKARCP